MNNAVITIVCYAREQFNMFKLARSRPVASAFGASRVGNSRCGRSRMQDKKLMCRIFVDRNSCQGAPDHNNRSEGCQSTSTYLLTCFERYAKDLF